MKFKQFISLGLCTAVALNSFPLSSVLAEENISRYPYALFAGSDTEGAITINANNACINGNIATNGTIVSSSANFNVNGAITENANETTIQCFNKIDGFYFSTATVQTYFEDYFCEETNININNPIDAEGNISLIGNINISCGLKALNNVNMSGNVENTQNSAICSRLGDIIIDSENVNLNGIIYAPNGNVSITAKNLNINSVVIIADTITINCPNLNANYSSSIGEFIGIESETTVTDTEIDLFAYGEYVSETNSIKVLWDTTVPNGNFDIQASDDGLNYVSVGTVTDATEYEYAISEPFSIKYVKVIETTNNGAICESIPFMIKNNEDGIYIDFLDTDEDGLPDFFEIEIGTAVDNVDTDADGLTDYQEFIIVGTDPTIYDSVKTGVSDAEVDNDNDGLTNIDELIRTTNPNDSDTDMDGLSDYDEIFVYNTDPLVADSDEDGVDDGSEIKLGFNPNSSSTYGVPDGEYKISQTIGKESDILSFVNTEESPYSLSIEMKTNGDIEKEINVVDSGYSNTIDNDAMIGASLDISMSDFCSPEDIILRYDIKSEYTENTLNKYSSLDEFKGIKRLNVFQFDEDEGMLLPVNTQFNDDGTQLYAEVDELGTYCIMDMEIWLDNLTEEPVIDDAPIPKAASRSTSLLGYYSNQINLVFILQANYAQSSGETEEEYKEKFEFQKNIIRKMSNVAFEKLKDIELRFYIVLNDNNAVLTNINSADGKNYFTNKEEVSNVLENLSYTKEDSPVKRQNAFICVEAFTPALNFYSNTFVYYLLNGPSTIDSHKVEDGYIMCDAYYIQKILDAYNLYSQVYFSENDFYPNVIADEYPDLSKEIETFGGISIPIDTISNSNFNRIKEHFLSKVQERLGIVLTDTYDIIVPTKWKRIKLDKILSPNSSTDTDKDNLTDWQEVDTSKIMITDNDNIILPTFTIGELISYLTRFNTNSDYNFLVNDFSQRYYLPILSDPSDEDTDDDGYKDFFDPRPMINDITVTKLSQEYIRVDYSTVNSDEKDDDWENKTESTNNRYISYGGNQEWFKLLEKDIPNEEKRNVISQQGCGLIAMADLALYLAKSNPEIYSNSLTQDVLETINSNSKNNVLDFNIYKKYVLDFEKEYVNMHIPSLKLYAVPLNGSGKWIIINSDEKTIINSNDGRMGILLTQYFKKNNINLNASWCFNAGILPDYDILFNRIKSLISRDIPAIIAIGPCSEENAINLYELKTESIDRIASYNEINTVRNHYFNVTAIIEDKVKIDNGYWDGIMYEVSSWGSKYYISKKDMDDFITVHTPFFTNVVNVY